MKRLAWLSLSCTLACTTRPPPPEPPRRHAEVSGFAELPAQTFAGGPRSGSALDPATAAGAPWAEQPVQGISALLSTGTDDELLALADNGYGTLANSADFELKLYRLGVSWEDGSLSLIRAVPLTDPGGKLGWPRPPGPLTGAELDPESLARAPDGSLWIGDERGPFLLHFSETGELLGPPLPVPVPAPLLAHGKGQPILRSPDHPALAALPEKERLAAASVGRSRGVEALAAAPGAKLAYAFLEQPLLDDPDRTRVPVLAVDLEAGAFTGESFWYRLEAEGNAVTDAASIGVRTLLVLERDDKEGAGAQLKRLYEVRLDRVAADGRLEKRLVADLLDLRDPEGLGPSEDGVLRMQQQTPEAVLALGPGTVLVATDNNFPFGRARDPDEPENTELVRVELPPSNR